MGTLFKCPFCNRKYVNKEAVLEHMDKEHNDELNGLPPAQVYFNYMNRYMLTKANGRSVISGKPTAWNPVTNRYERFLPEEKELYRAYFLKNMKRAGKENIMKDMEHQKEMLAARHISGKYTWTDGIEMTYTGSYEKKFLEFLDLILRMPSSDIMTPAPQLFPYTDGDGTERVHIPDVYITSLNLIVNIKSKDNKFYRLRDIERERQQDKAIEQSNFNYIKLYDNEFGKFIPAIEKIKANIESGKSKKVIIESLQDIEESMEILID